MRWVFDADPGRRPAARSRRPGGLQPLSVLARHAWRGAQPGSRPRSTCIADLQALGRCDRALRRRRPKARRFLAFCDEARRVYAAPRRARTSARSGPSVLRMIARPRPARAGHAGRRSGRSRRCGTRLGRHFHDPRLRQLFGRYATYCGASPWQAPATLMLVAQVEHGRRVVGATAACMRCAQAVGRAGARSAAPRLRYGQAVRAHPRARRPRLRRAPGRRRELAADSVVFNGDANALAQRPARRRRPPRRAATRAAPRAFAVGADLGGARAHAAASRWRATTSSSTTTTRASSTTSSAAASCRGRAPCTSARRTAATAPRRRRRANACCASSMHRPTATAATFDPSEIEPCEQRSLALLQHCGLQLERARRSRWCAHAGGLPPPVSGHGRGAVRAGDARLDGAVPTAAASTSRLPGLYLAGGSVHPGPGVPMAAMSGRLAAETLLAHLDSTSRSRRVVISGGTSTPSATTAGTG